MAWLLLLVMVDCQLWERPEVTCQGLCWAVWGTWGCCWAALGAWHEMHVISAVSFTAAALLPDATTRITAVLNTLPPTDGIFAL